MPTEISARDFSEKMLVAVKGYVGRAVIALSARLDSIEKAIDKRLSELPHPEKGEKGDSVVGPQGMAGKSAYDFALERGFSGTEDEWLASLQGPPGKDGESIKGDTGERGPAGESIVGPQGERGEMGPRGERGEPGIAGEIGAPGLRGETGPQGERGADGLRGEKGDPGERGEKGEKGDATVGPQGPQGERGADGRDGRDGVDGVGVDGRDAAQIRPQDGIDDAKSYPEGTYAFYRGGLIWASRSTDPIKDGDMKAAGWRVAMCGQYDDNEEVLDEGRVIRRTVCWTDRTVVTERKTKNVIYRGIFNKDRAYDPGDQVTWGGETWHCMTPTSVAPQHDHNGTRSDWVLSSKKGRDGKPGINGAKGDRGAEGPRGKDLTQIGYDGKKW